MLGYFFNPVRHCCVSSDEVPCVRSLGGDANPLEIFDDSSPALPSTVEVLVEGKGHGHLPAGPKERVIRTFATSEEEPLRGEPLCCGHILQLKLGVAIEDVTLTLYVNGFCLEARGESAGPEGEQITPTGRIWSPFSLVEKCQVKTMQHSSLWAVFKLTVFRQEGDDRYFYFATTGKDAFRERDRWVDEISSAIRQVTLSLFPPHAITVRPLPGIESTTTRIMAGYLLRSLETDNVSLFYCELHAYIGGEARLSIYKDEWCEREVSSVLLTDQTVVSTRKGSYCTVFGVDQHRFCARTREEKELWLRAVSNIKVKLMFDAPDPTSTELAVFRAAVLERIVKLEGIASGPSDNKDKEKEKEGAKPPVRQDAWDPLLSQVPRQPQPLSPRGDVWYPDPIEEGAENILEGSTRQVAPAVHREDTDTSEGDRVDIAKLHAAEAVEVLAPEECRKLLASVGSMASMSKDCGMEPGVVAAEAPGNIRTVHTTGKVLFGQQEGCNNPEEACTVSCHDGPKACQKEKSVQENTIHQRNMLQAQPAEATPNIPLLMWSPGRRQMSQRAV
mmetsp:Transcript_25303/g.46390  ORF Transcript_25303/g.46390 Transcript_25303/m.46390 type:complete len:560 (+) Transcript_25303:180-1859(+)